MKTIAFDNLPAGSIVLAKRYTLWQRFKAWLTGKTLKYNEAFIDPFGGSFFMFSNTFWDRWNIYTFCPKKPYSKKESFKLTDVVFNSSVDNSDEIEQLLRVNLVRSGTFTGVTFEEMLDNNKYYTKKQVA